MKCRNCGKEIRFMRTRNGKMMPVDTGRIFYKDGNKDRLITETGEVISCEIVHPLDDELQGFGYMPHFATCKKFKKLNAGLPDEDKQKQLSFL